MSQVHVLVVDDSVTMRAMLEQVISSDGACQVVGAAADATAAVELMRTKRPDVMTLDLTMPGTNGLQFLRDIDGERHPPVIVVSSASKPGADETMMAIEAGAVACFDKANLLADAPKFRRALRRAAKADPSTAEGRRAAPHITAVSRVKRGE